MSELKELIQFLSYHSNLHICIHDISGISSHDRMQLDVRNKIHSTRYCDLAKSTRRGYELCIRCKNRANQKAVASRTPFYGICPYGMLEIAHPIILNETILGIIYIGNILPEQDAYLEKLHRASHLTGVSAKQLKAQSALCETDRNIPRYLQMAELLSREICRLWQEEEKKNPSRGGGVVSNVLECLAYHYAQDITLKNLATLYFINEKYLGRLFRKETGKTFHQYLNDVRLTHAVQLLTDTPLSVLQISLECGYANVTYFNRVFRAKFGVTPLVYRNRHKEHT